MLVIALIVTVCVVWFTIFLISDAGLPLYLSTTPPPNAFRDQVIWVIGASSGIGAQLAEDFAKQSGKVILSARRVDKLEALSKKCSDLYEKSLPSGAGSSDGPASMVLPLDVTKHETHATALAEILKVYGRIDLVVFNSGIYDARPVNDTPLDRVRELMDVNYISYVALTKTILPHMVEKNHGKVRIIPSFVHVINDSFVVFADCSSLLLGRICSSSSKCCVWCNKICDCKLQYFLFLITP